MWRWRITMPWFVKHRFPADYAGSNLCWRGDVMWPGADGHYQLIRHAGMACRTLRPSEIGRPIFAAAIKPGSLAMVLHPPAGIEVRLIAHKAAALQALAVFTKPVFAPMAGIVLGGAGLAALVIGQWRRVAGLCVAFLPVLLMPLHNWYFGHVFVLFSTNADQPTLLVMPSSAWLAAFTELAHLNFSGTHLHTALTQIGTWLSGPGESLAFVPFNAAGVAVVAYVTLRGRDFDPWLHLIGAAVLAECVPDLIYIATSRHFLSMWLLSALIVSVFLAQRVLPRLEKSGSRKGPVPGPLRCTAASPTATP